MTDYYVQVRKGGAWHRWNGVAASHEAACSQWVGSSDWFGQPRGTIAISTEPQQPLCKRCERSKR